MGIGLVMAEGLIAIILTLANETIMSAMTCFHRAHGILRIFLLHVYVIVHIKEYVERIMH